MANFRTHVTVAAVGSGLLSTVCLGAGVASPGEIMTLSVVGTLGGILPDIDSDHSTPIRILFTGLGFVTAFLVVFAHVDQYSTLELWLLWLLVYAFIRYPAWFVFTRFTVHRGVFHSLAAGLFFGLLMTNLSYVVFACRPLLAWIIGSFVCLGYILHLLLDELFSVDFMSTRIKRSFGTAFKVIDYGNLGTSAAMVGAVCVLYLIAPEADSFAAIFLNEETYRAMSARFWPSAGLFR